MQLMAIVILLRRRSYTEDLIDVVIIHQNHIINMLVTVLMIHFDRAHSGHSLVTAICNNFQLSRARLKKPCVPAVSKKNALQLDQQDSSFKESDEKSPKNIRQGRRSRKKVTEETPDQSPADMIATVEEEEKILGGASIEASQKSTSRVQNKGVLQFLSSREPCMFLQQFLTVI